MLFNSLQFLVFLPIVFLLYWFVFDYAVKSHRQQLTLQNLFILVASYVFYGWWDWRYLILIAFTSVCSWASGLLISQSHSKKVWLAANIIINLLILGAFKYYNFFLTEFYRLFGIGDFSGSRLYISIVLPVGISFYTFQALSYSIDVYRKKIAPTNDVIAFMAYISFFPQLVAGPIERATNLLPQFLSKRTFDYSQAVDGIKQILWGFFKKIVIADNCAIYVDRVFADYASQSGSTLLVAAFLFTIQIYCDFSGYSDIAIGTAKLFGIKLMRNFNVPYFSRDIAEFWRRWHISLTTWFRDYVYIPLGGSRPQISDKIKNPAAYKKLLIARNTFVIFLVSGLWHGANWTFIAWGLYHACLFLPLILLGKNRKYTNAVATGRLEDGSLKLNKLPNLREAFQMIITFGLALAGWIIFRCATITDAYRYFRHIFSKSVFSVPWLIDKTYYIPVFLFICVMIIVEWLTRDKEHGGVTPDIKHSRVYYVFYMFLLLCIEFYFVKTLGETHQFIYFQF